MKYVKRNRREWHGYWARAGRVGALPLLALAEKRGFLSCRDEKRHRIRVKSLEDIIHILGRPRVVAAPGAQGATGVPQGLKKRLRDGASKAAAFGETLCEAGEPSEGLFC